MSKITRIDINLPMQSEWYEVGDKVLQGFENRIITRIVDASLEYPDTFTHIVQVYVDDDGASILAKEFINTPMSITYGDDS